MLTAAQIGKRFPVSHNIPVRLQHKSLKLINKHARDQASHKRPLTRNKLQNGTICAAKFTPNVVAQRPSRRIDADYAGTDVLRFQPKRDILSNRYFGISRQQLASRVCTQCSLVLYTQTREIEPTM